jgi:hypothetical protein
LLPFDMVWDGIGVPLCAVRIEGARSRNCQWEPIEWVCSVE